MALILSLGACKHQQIVPDPNNSVIVDPDFLHQQNGPPDDYVPPAAPTVPESDKPFFDPDHVANYLKKLNLERPVYATNPPSDDLWRAMEVAYKTDQLENRGSDWPPFKQELSRGVYLFSQRGEDSTLVEFPHGVAYWRTHAAQPGESMDPNLNIGQRNIVAKGYYRQGLRHGPWKRLNEDNSRDIITFRYGYQHGETRHFDSSGSLYLRAHYRWDKLDGMVEFWQPDGNYFAETFVCGVEHGQYIECDIDGRLLRAGNRHDGVPWGLWQYWNDSEYPVIFCYLIEGVIQGWAGTYTSSGTLAFIQWYTDGQASGPFYAYGKEGEVFTVARKQNGILDGPSTDYYPSGAVLKKSTFKDGKLDGEVTVYYESGGPHLVYHYKDGKLHGALVKYDRDGSITERQEYRDDELLAVADTPEAAAEAWLKAIKAEDFDAYLACYAPDARAEIENDAGAFKKRSRKRSIVDWELGDTDAGDTTADLKVSVTISNKGGGEETLTITVSLEKVDGAWWVSSTDSDP
ncbi:MAG: hypothetical protein KDB82_16730 [Planctomycetes bacterium]|nr:hypothetical protein [Planctomycetota bacterium]